MVKALSVMFIMFGISALILAIYLPDALDVTPDSQYDICMSYCSLNNEVTYIEHHKDVFGMTTIIRENDTATFLQCNKICLSNTTEQSS